MEANRYVITVNGSVYGAKRRVDHAKKVYGEAVAENIGKEVVLLDTNGNTVVERTDPKTTTKKEGPVRRTVNRVSEVSPATSVKKDDPIVSKKKKCGHDNGDEVAVALRGMTVSQTCSVARLILKSCGNEKFEKRDFGKITSAEGRKNVGSARMSLGLMIRKYCKYMGRFDILTSAVSKVTNGN